MFTFRKVISRLLVLMIFILMIFQTNQGLLQAQSSEIVETEFFKPWGVITNNWSLPCLLGCGPMSLDQITDQNHTLRDADRTTAYVSPLNQGQNYIIGYNYSINLPANANVTGIELQILYAPWNGNTGYEGNVTAELMWNNRASQTNTGKWDYEMIDFFGEYSGSGNNFKNATLGNSTDTWGRIWDVNDFSNANFGVKLSFTLVSGNDFALDIAWIKLHYEILEITSETQSPTSDQSNSSSSDPSSESSSNIGSESSSSSISRSTTPSNSQNTSVSTPVEESSSSISLPLPFSIVPMLVALSIITIFSLVRKHNLHLK